MADQMPDPTFCFHIIFVPSTVRPLLPLTTSLLTSPACSLRLVANGCLPEERQLLQRLCDQDSRLVYMNLSVKRVLPHGVALSYLQAQETSPFFCFMDSDILATGDFIETYIPYLDDHAAVFSATPIVFSAEDCILPWGAPMIDGRFSRTTTGLCLGTSYFAIYHNTRLSRLIQSTGIDFKEHFWSDVPSGIRRIVGNMGMQKQRYGTGKLLNLLFLAQGEKLVQVESPHVTHLGGLSVRSLDVRKTGLTGWIKQSLWRFRRFIGQWRYHRASVNHQRFCDRARLVFPQHRRRVISAYFNHLLIALSEGQPLPKPPSMEDADVQQHIVKTAALLQDLNCTFRQQFQAS